jgi:excisionase family DNA binding protein
MNEPKPLSLQEAATRLGVHRNTVRAWARKGLITAYRLPGSGYHRFDVAEVERVRLSMMSPPAVMDASEAHLLRRLGVDSATTKEDQ